MKVWLFLFFAFCFANEAKKPTVLVFMCNYGSGHRIATQAIIQSLPNANLQVIDVYNAHLKKIDPIQKASSFWNIEKWYNRLLKFEYNHFLNFAFKIGPSIVLLKKGKMQRVFYEHIQTQKPDLLISCLPIINPVLYECAKKLNIPLLVVSTDLDIYPFCFGFSEKQVLGPNLKITAAYSKAKLQSKYKAPEYLQKYIQYDFGYPLRPHFSKTFGQKELDLIRKKLLILPNEKVILIMMGNQAPRSAMMYAKLFLSMSNEEIDQILGTGDEGKNIHLLILCGNVGSPENLHAMNCLNALNKGKKRVYIHAMPGTSQIAHLISLNELSTVITKPGGSTVNEMIKKQIPMVFHVSSTPLDWEVGNMLFSEHIGLGKRFVCNSKVNKKNRKALVQALTTTFQIKKELTLGLRTILESKIDFTANLQKSVDELLSMKKCPE